MGIDGQKYLVRRDNGFFLILYRLINFDYFIKSPGLSGHPFHLFIKCAIEYDTILLLRGKNYFFRLKGKVGEFVLVYFIGEGVLNHGLRYTRYPIVQSKKLKAVGRIGNAW